MLKHKIVILILISCVISFADELTENELENKSRKTISYTFGFGNYSPFQKLDGQNIRYRESIIHYKYLGKEGSGFAILFGSLNAMEDYFGFCEGDVEKTHKNKYNRVLILPTFFHNWKYFGFDTGLFMMLASYGGCSDGFVGGVWNPMFEFRAGLLDKLFLSFSLYDDLLYFNKSAGVNVKNITIFSSLFLGGFWENDDAGLIFKSSAFIYKGLVFNFHMHKKAKISNPGFRLGLLYIW